MLSRTGENKLANLVDRLIEALAAENQLVAPVKTLVGHRWPDGDVWFNWWIAKKWIPTAKDAKIVFVRAGEILPGSEGDPSVIHFDTGGGEFDQHGKSLIDKASASLLVERLGLQEDPGLKSLLEMVEAADNVRPLPPTSIHYAMEGYPRRYRRPDGIIDWETVQARVFELFDIIYEQETQRAESRKELEKHTSWIILPNKIKVAMILWHPHLREAAFEKGAHVVVWTITRKPHKFWVGIQMNRNFPQLHLRGVVVKLRKAEAEKRDIDVQGRTLGYIGQEGVVGSTWFIHDSLNLVLSGSRSHPLRDEEFTLLAPGQIVDLVCLALSRIPQERVAGE